MGFIGWIVLGLIAGAIANAEETANQTAQNAQTLGIVGGIVLAVILLLAYYCGGYVAGRMARFDGVKQGLAVWLWGIVIAIIVAILAAVAGSKFDILGNLGAVPQIPLDGSALTASGLIGLAIVLLIPLIGAILGGKAGMHYHRKIDQVGANHRTGFTG